MHNNSPNMVRRMGLMVSHITEILNLVGISATEIDLHMDASNPHLTKITVSGYLDEQMLADTATILMFIAKVNDTPAAKDLLNQIEMLLKLQGD